MAVVAEKEVKATKAKQVTNYYVSSKGEKSSRPQADVVAVGKVFLESNTVVEKKLKDLPEDQQRQAMAFGIMQVGSNAYGAAGSEDERIEMLEDRWETIFGGSWASDRQVGPRTSDIIEAFAQAKFDDSGTEVDDAWRTKIKGMLEAETPEITAKGLLENPAIRAKYDAIKAQRALERSKKSADALGSSDKVALPDL